MNEHFKQKNTIMYSNHLKRVIGTSRSDGLRATLVVGSGVLVLWSCHKRDDHVGPLQLNGITTQAAAVGKIEQLDRITLEETIKSSLHILLARLQVIVEASDQYISIKERCIEYKHKLHRTTLRQGVQNNSSLYPYLAETSRLLAKLLNRKTLRQYTHKVSEAPTHRRGLEASLRAWEQHMQLARAYDEAGRDGLYNKMENILCSLNNLLDILKTNTTNRPVTYNTRSETVTL